MGWSSMSVSFNSRDTKRIKKFFEDQYERETNFEMLDYAKKGNVLYMAVKRLDTQEIFATVTLISFHEGDFYWKEMDDTVGPCERECPKRILKMLTPAKSENAIKWRECCWEYHEKKKTDAKTYKHGDLLEFPREITFTNGLKGTQFILVKEGRSFGFAFYKGQTELSRVYAGYKITRWRESEPVVIGSIA